MSIATVIANDPAVAYSKHLINSHTVSKSNAQRRAQELEKELAALKLEIFVSSQIIKQEAIRLSEVSRTITVHWQQAAAKYSTTTTTSLTSPTSWMHFSFLQVLPIEVLLHIFSYLSARELCVSMTCCHLFATVMYDESLWQSLYSSPYELVPTVVPKGINKLMFELLKKARSAECQKQSKLFLESIQRKNDTRKWYQHFKQKHHLDKNWRQNHCTVTALTGHTGDVICLQYEGDILVSGGGDNSLRIWDLQTKKCVRKLWEHTRDIFCLQFSDKKIYSGSGDTTVKLWDAETGQCLRSLNAHEKSVSCLQADGNLLISGCAAGKLIMWDTRSGSPVDTIQAHDGLVWCMQFQGNRLASGGSDKQLLKLWDLSTRSMVRHFEGHTDWIGCLQLGGALLASGSRDSSVKMWDINTGQCVNTFLGHTAIVYSLQFNATKLLSGCDDNQIRWWDISSGECYKTIKGTQQDAILCMQFSEERLVTGSYDHTIDVYDFS